MCTCPSLKAENDIVLSISPVITPAQLTLHISVFNHLLCHCLSLVSVAEIKYHNKRQLWGWKGLFGLEFETRVHHFVEVKTETQAAGHITSVGMSTGNKCILACFMLVYTSFLFFYTVLSHLPREWCHPQWAWPSHIN